MSRRDRKASAGGRVLWAVFVGVFAIACAIVIMSCVNGAVPR